MAIQYIHETIEQISLNNPFSPALISEDKVLNFYDLNARINQLANRLLFESLTPQMRVGILLKRSPEFVVSILAVLKVNGTYLPLDASYPHDRLQYFIQDSQISLLITTDEYADMFADIRKIIINDCLFDCRTELNDVATIASPETPAYIIYTSGTTGHPKGVLMSHKSISVYVHALGKVINLTSDDRYLHTASFSFSASIRQLMLPLSHGAAAVLATDEDKSDPLRLLNLIHKQNVTILDTFPSYLRSVLKSLELISSEKREFFINNSMRFVLTTSEALTYDIPFAWRKQFGHRIRFLNMYGQTETCGINTVYEVPFDSENSTRTVPVGNVYGSGQVHILDTSLNSVKSGELGEIYVTGSPLAIEYINAPQLTSEKFRNNLKNEFEIAYRTGDLGEIQQDGNILLLGRSDHQIKVRGYRIFPSEIEICLYGHPFVQDAKAKVNQSKAGSSGITAYVVVTDESITAEKLREYLSKKIPAYMIPTIVILKKMPLLPNGKVDYKKLPEPSAQNCLAHPQTNLQSDILSIWKKLLNTENIGIDDDFFQCGGDSLTAASLFYEIENLTGKRIPLATLFNNPTIRKISQIFGNTGDSEWSSLVLIRPGGDRPPLYCVHGVGGNVLSYKSLINYVNLNRPLYGLQAKGLDGSSAPFYSIEEMAAHYISEIKKLQPIGPYYLGGYSFGGWVAFEMVRQLTDSFDDVALLVLFDTRKTFESPGALKDQNFHALFKKRAVYHVKELLNSQDKLKYIKARLRTVYRRNRNKYKDFITNRYLETNENGTCENRMSNSLKIVEAACWSALRKYKPRKIHRRITLILTRGIHPFYRTPNEEWGNLADDLDIHYVSGTHNTIFNEPYVQELADILNTVLD